VAGLLWDLCGSLLWDLCGEQRCDLWLAATVSLQDCEKRPKAPPSQGEGVYPGIFPVVFVVTRHTAWFAVM
jgi:hypothetical protein